MEAHNHLNSSGMNMIQIKIKALPVYCCYQRDSDWYHPLDLLVFSIAFNLDAFEKKNVMPSIDLETTVSDLYDCHSIYDAQILYGSFSQKVL